jgi:hypothetical protein
LGIATHRLRNHGVKVFENISRIFEPKRQDVTGSSQLVRFPRYYYGEEIKDDEMGNACSKERERSEVH